MHVTPFSAATILVFATASPLHAQGIRISICPLALRR
jgi:hypothetical protein